MLKKYLLAVTLLATANLALAEEFVEWVGANSGVNWSAGQIQSEGAGIGPASAPPSTAKMMACRAAIIDAQRNLLESIQGVRVEGTTIVANMMVESDVIKTSVNGLLRGARVIKRDPQDDGSCIVQMTAPLGGKFAKEVYEQTLPAQKTSSLPGLPATYAIVQPRVVQQTLADMLNLGLNFLVPQARAETIPAPTWQDSLDRLTARLTVLEELVSSHPAIIEVKQGGPTGLVIDARGSNFIPSMTPRIRKLRAGVLYPNDLQQTERRERGQLVSLFTRDLDTARRHPIVGERPIVLKAMRTFGDTRTEIVLGTDSSDSLQALIDKGFLTDSGVIIVL
jgi:hypothetical protein